MNLYRHFRYQKLVKKKNIKKQDLMSIKLKNIVVFFNNNVDFGT